MDAEEATSQGGSASDDHVRSKDLRSGNGPSLHSPPYWQHTRSVSQTSVESIGHGLISLEDNTDDFNDSGALWAREITIEDYVIVRGETGIGAYVVFNIKVQTLKVPDLADPRSWGLTHARRAAS